MLFLCRHSWSCSALFSRGRASTRALYGPVRQRRVAAAARHSRADGRLDISLDKPGTSVSGIFRKSTRSGSATRARSSLEPTTSGCISSTVTPGLAGSGLTIWETSVWLMRNLHCPPGARAPLRSLFLGGVGLRHSRRQLERSGRWRTAGSR